MNTMPRKAQKYMKYIEGKRANEAIKMVDDSKRKV